METQLIIGGRQCGKTLHLIKRAHEEWLYILVRDRDTARNLFKQAKEMKLDIPFPITINEYLSSGQLRGSSARRDGILIDNIDDIFLRLFRGVPVHEMTLDDHNVWDVKRLIDHGDALESLRIDWSKENYEEIIRKD